MVHRPELQRAAALIALVLAAFTGCGGEGEGARAYREGRFRDAHRDFVELCDSQGDSASPRLLHNRALTALLIGELRDADAAAERATRTAGPDIEHRLEFLRGNIAFAHALLAQEQASAVEAEPFAIEVAIGYAKTARDRWMQAAASRDHWPEASRNVQRALVKIEELESMRTPAEGRKERSPEPRPLPVPDPDPGVSRTDPDAEPEAQLTELTPEQVARLFERLAEKEREKLSLRRARHRARMAEVERDW